MWKEGVDFGGGCCFLDVFGFVVFDEGDVGGIC